MRLFILTLLLLVGCGDPVPVPNADEQDDDGDGWPGATDCDDGNSQINPSALELCDASSVDEDCDGAANDLDPEGPTDPSDWYTDGDGDGFAAEGGSSVSACDAPAGHAALLGDCDDADVDVHPDATEVCDPLDADEDCNGVADDADPATLAASLLPWFSDADGDGWGDPAVTLAACEPPAGHVADGTDCDDGNPLISPDANEVCDDADVDEDCDGGADDADVTGDEPFWRSTFNLDEDGDGYGGDRTVEACDLSAGRTEYALDCDDTDAAISPSAVESCDSAGTDEDCDALVNDADPSVTGRAMWYADRDGDGFGGTDGVEACAAPPAHYADGSDCDDSDATIYVGAQEVCDTTDTDEDCDTLSDDLDPSAIGQSTWYQDLDGDGWGTTAETLSRCDLPTGYSAESDDCDDAAADISPDEAEVCADGVDQDCDGEDADCRYEGEGEIESEYDTKIYATSEDAEFGTRLAGGDFDGDGVGDLIVAAPSGSYYDSGQGFVAWYPGPFTTAPRSSASDDAQTVYNTDTAHSGSYGDLLENVGDIDADGADDFVIGGASQAAWLFLGGGSGVTASTSYAASVTCSSASGAPYHVSGALGWLCGNGEDDTYGSNRGQAIVYEGLSTVHTRYVGETDVDRAGTAVAAGDVNGDGLTDAWIGAYGDDDAGSSAGAAYLVYGPASGGVVNLSSADAKVLGAIGTNAFGTRVSSPGDVDHDGYDDLLASAPLASSTGTWEGKVYLFTAIPSGSSSATAAAATIVGENSSLFLGANAFVGGDIDGDEDLDLLFGSPYDGDGGSGAGAAWLLYGPHAGTIPLTAADAAWRGDDPSDGLGSGVALVPDIDGDGDREIAMGAPAAENMAALDRGAIWVIDGR